MILATNGIIQSKAAAAPAGIVTANLQIYLQASNIVSYPGTGTAWNDISVNSRNFVINNTPIFETVGGVTGFRLNGTNQNMAGSFARIPTTNKSTFTFITVFKRNGSQGSETKLMFANTSFGNSGLGITGTKLQWEWAGGDYNVDTGLVIPDNTWCFAALTVSATEVKVYLNSSVFTKAVSYPSGYFGGMWIASQNTVRYLLGSIGCAMVYDATLTPAEISQNYIALGSL
jgi:hypothetical protein